MTAPRPSQPAPTIYFDYNASTPVLTRVKDVMVRALEHGFGNPSSDHPFGKRARAFVETARVQVAALLGAETEEIVFTSGGTESNNLAIRGFAIDTDGPLHWITTEAEHPAVTAPVAAAMRGGASGTTVPLDANGVVDLAAMERALAAAPAKSKVLVSVILAQNETGVLQPVEQIVTMAKKRGALVHTDAAQAVGKIPVDVRQLGVDLLSVAGHKLYASKGVGALYVRRGVRLSPLVVGAGHERGLRPGTENVASIAGLGEACALAREDVGAERDRLASLRIQIESRLVDRGFVVHGARAPRLPNTINARFPGVRGSTLLARAPMLAFSAGSACHAGEEHPSRALTAMGLDRESALGAIRLSFGRLTTAGDAERAIQALVAASTAGEI